MENKKLIIFFVIFITFQLIVAMLYGASQLFDNIRYSTYYEFYILFGMNTLLPIGIFILFTLQMHNQRVKVLGILLIGLIGLNVMIVSIQQIILIFNSSASSFGTSNTNVIFHFVIAVMLLIGYTMYLQEETKHSTTTISILLVLVYVSISVFITMDHLLERLIRALNINQFIGIVELGLGYVVQVPLGYIAMFLIVYTLIEDHKLTKQIYEMPITNN